ncbi:MAG: YIP1 family protein [Haloarculaceae archaeon]
MSPNPIPGPAQVLFFPERVFRDNRSDLDDGRRVVLAVAGVHPLGDYLLLLGGAVFVSRQQTTYGVPELLADLELGVYGFGPVLALSVVLLWLLVSAVLHVAIELLHGEGTYGDTLSVVGRSSPATLLGLLGGASASASPPGRIR